MSQSQPSEPSKFLKFQSAPYGTKDANGNLVLNRFSSTITQGHEFPAAQAMLYAAGVKDDAQMTGSPQVGTKNPMAATVHCCFALTSPIPAPQRPNALFLQHTVRSRL